ncbi:MAG: CPBP family glutamic-type intramembrane protease [Methylococcales bacterium]
MNSRYSPWIVCLLALAYLFGAVVAAALLAYPIHQWLDLNISFPRLVNRLGLGLLIIGIIPAFKTAGLTWADMGFPGRGSIFARQFSQGFLLGLAILGIVILTVIALGVRNLLPDEVERSERILKYLGGALATALGVSIVEESLFRGLLFGALTKYANARSALPITAFFYAELHFIGRRGEVAAEILHWTSGLELVPAALLQIFDPANLDSFLALFVVSLFLCAVRLETPLGIGYCIGLHTAWVFLLKLTKRYTALAPDSPWSFLVGTYDGVIGILVAFWLGLITIYYFYRIRKNQGLKHSTIE